MNNKNIEDYKKEWIRDRKHFFFNEELVNIDCEEIEGGSGYVLLSHDVKGDWFDVFIHLFDKNGIPYNWYEDEDGNFRAYLADNDEFINKAFKEIIGYEHPKKDEGFREERAESGMQGDTYIVVEIKQEFEEWLEGNYSRSVVRK